MVLGVEDQLEGVVDSWHVGAPAAARSVILASQNGLVLSPYLSEGSV